MKEYRNFDFLKKSYLVIQIWGSLQRLQHGRKKDYKISLIYVLVTKISKCKLKIQIKSTDRCRSREFFFTAFFEKGKKRKVFSLRLVTFVFLIYLFFLFNRRFLSL